MGAMRYSLASRHFRSTSYSLAKAKPPKVSKQASPAFQAASAGSDRELAADSLYNAGNALFEQGRIEFRHLATIAGQRDRTLAKPGSRTRRYRRRRYQHTRSCHFGQRCTPVIHNHDIGKIGLVAGVLQDG